MYLGPVLSVLSTGVYAQTQTVKSLQHVIIAASLWDILISAGLVPTMAFIFSFIPGFSHFFVF